MATVRKINRRQEISDLFIGIDPVGYWREVTNELERGERGEEHEMVPKVIAGVDEGRLLTEERYLVVIDKVLAAKANSENQAPYTYKVPIAYCMAQLEKLGMKTTAAFCMSQLKKLNK